MRESFNIEQFKIVQFLRFLIRKTLRNEISSSFSSETFSLTKKNYKPINNKQHSRCETLPKKRRKTINYDIFTKIFKEEENSSILMCFTCKRTATGRSYNANEGEKENACCKLEFFWGFISRDFTFANGFLSLLEVVKLHESH